MKLKAKFPLLPTLLLVLLYARTFLFFTFQRHYHFNSAGFDLGIQDQVV